MRSQSTLICFVITILMLSSTTVSLIPINNDTRDHETSGLTEKGRMSHTDSERCDNNSLIENTIVSSPETTLYYDDNSMQWNNTQEISQNSGWADFPNNNSTWVWPYTEAPGTYDFIHHFTLQSGAYDIEFYWSGLVDNSFGPSENNHSSVTIASNMNWILDIANPFNSSNNFDHYDEIEMGTGEIQGVPDSLNLSLQITARNRNSSSGTITIGGMIYDLEISYCLDSNLVDSDNDGVVDGEDAFPWNFEEQTDSDGDGIGDNMDECPNTPGGEAVNFVGCSTSIPIIDYLSEPAYGYDEPPLDVILFPSEYHFSHHPGGMLNLSVSLTEGKEIDSYLEATGYGQQQAPAGEGQTLVEVSQVYADILHVRDFHVPVEMVLSEITHLKGVVKIVDQDMMRTHLTEFRTSAVNSSSARAEDVHRASDVWAQGINGSGINVGIYDTGVDFASPALRGTQARVDNEASPYDGWPIMFSDSGMHQWQMNNKAMYGYVATSSTSIAKLNGVTNELELDTNGWIVTGIVSKSGIYHYNSAGYLVVDEDVAGVYDTVYYDLIQNDGIFSNEYPMKKGDEAGGYAVWGQGDNVWDRSAGTLYWISDGQNGVPYGDVFAAKKNIANRIPGSGDLILMMTTGGSSGSYPDHGTLCASAVAGQGTLPNGYGQGMAPGAKIIAIYDSPGSMGQEVVLEFLHLGYDGEPGSGDDANIVSHSYAGGGASTMSKYIMERDRISTGRGSTLTHFVATANQGPYFAQTYWPVANPAVISVGAFTSLEEEPDDTWGQPTEFSNRGPGPANQPIPHVTAVGYSHGGANALTAGSMWQGNTVNMWHGTSLASPIAAGIGALVMQAYIEEHGRQPTNEELRDILMSTSQNIGADVFTQGAGFLDAKQAVDSVLGENDVLSISPAWWNSGTYHGEHRSGNTNFNFPGDEDSISLEFTNQGDTKVSVFATPSKLGPLEHHNLSWEMDGNDNWDGQHNGPKWTGKTNKYGVEIDVPDMLIPIHIKTSEIYQIPQETVLLRARATYGSGGWDAEANLVFLKWTDVDGDGKWDNDLYGDDIIIDPSEWTEDVSEFSFLNNGLKGFDQSIIHVGQPMDIEADGILLAVWRKDAASSSIVNIEIDWSAFGYQVDTMLTLTPPNGTPPNGGGSGASKQTSSDTLRFPVQANSAFNLDVYLEIPWSATPDMVIHGLRIETEGWTENHEWFWPVITHIASNGPYETSLVAVDHDVEDQRLYTNQWLSGDGGGFPGIRKSVAYFEGFSSDGYLLQELDWDARQPRSNSVLSCHQYEIPTPTPYVTNPRYGPYVLGGGGVFPTSPSVNPYCNFNHFSAFPMYPGFHQVVPSLSQQGSGSYDVPISTSMQYFGPVTEHLSSTHSGSSFPYYSGQFIGSSKEYTVTDVTADSLYKNTKLFTNQQVQQDTGWEDQAPIGSPSLLAPTFSYVQKMTFTAGEEVELIFDCDDPSNRINYFLVEDDGDGVFTSGNSQGTSDIFGGPLSAGLGWSNLRKVDADNSGTVTTGDYWSTLNLFAYNNNKYASGSDCDTSFKVTIRTTGDHWLIAAGGLNVHQGFGNGGTTWNGIQGVANFDVIRKEEVSGILRVDNWNAYNLLHGSAAGLAPNWDADMGGLGSLHITSVMTVIHVELEHDAPPNPIDGQYIGQIIVTIEDGFGGTKDLTFPYKYWIGAQQQAPNYRISQNTSDNGDLELSGDCGPGDSITTSSGDGTPSSEPIECGSEGVFSLVVPAGDIDYSVGVTLTIQPPTGLPFVWHTDVDEPPEIQPEETEEESGIFGLPGFGVESMMIAIVVAAFIRRKRQTPD